MRRWIVCGSPIQWKHAHCTEQSMRRWIVCGSPGVFLCSTGWQSLRVSPLSVTELLDHRRFQQICLNASCFALGTALRGIRIGTALWGIRRSCFSWQWRYNRCRIAQNTSVPLDLRSSQRAWYTQPIVPLSSITACRKIACPLRDRVWGSSKSQPVWWVRAGEEIILKAEYTCSSAST